MYKKIKLMMNQPRLVGLKIFWRRNRNGAKA